MEAIEPLDLVNKAQSLGFKTELNDKNEIRIQMKDATLLVTEPDSAADIAIGFEGTPWHFHSVLMLMTGESSYVQLDVHAVLKGLRRGNILVCERWLREQLQDRWLSHQDEPFSLKDMEPGEELRIYNIS